MEGNRLLEQQIAQANTNAELMVIYLGQRKRGEGYVGGNCGGKHSACKLDKQKREKGVSSV